MPRASLLRLLVSGLHRHVWPLIPQRARRAALFAAAGVIAPKPGRPQDGPGPLPIIVVGAFRTASGLGESARLCHGALAEAGAPVFAIDISEGLMQPLDLDLPSFRDGRAVRGPATLVVHVNAPLFALAMLALGRDVVSGRRVVGYWAWELPAAPGEWRRGAAFVHDVWATSRFTADALRPIASGARFGTLWHPIALSQTRMQARVRASGATFTVVTVFNMASSYARKNPAAAVEAFGRAFGDDASTRLVVKCSHGDVYPAGLADLRARCARAGNIDLVERVMTAGEMDGLYRDADVLISLHRSEGFGLTLGEAMLRGLPVVATGWSGNADFLTPDTGCPVASTLVPARDPQGTYDHPDMVWAEPDVDAAASALKALRADPDQARALGASAQAFAIDAFGSAAYARRVAGLLGIEPAELRQVAHEA